MCEILNVTLRLFVMDAIHVGMTTEPLHRGFANKFSQSNLQHNVSYVWLLH